MKYQSGNTISINNGAERKRTTNLNIGQNGCSNDLIESFCKLKNIVHFMNANIQFKQFNSTGAQSLENFSTIEYK